MIKHIIFYGTLMAKEGGRGRSNHSPECTLIGDITFKGRLHSVGGFPALVMGDEDIHGELFEINDQSVVNGAFDRIEGYSGRKDQDMYTRTVMYVPEHNVYAWVYTWNGNPSKLPWIECGNWSTYREEAYARQC
jgi:gamma-glutamylcyclotransferase (GGCT)/AIG2-like uncharacterized protein YtfP